MTDAEKINIMSDAGLKEPVFEMDSFFRATFYRDPRYSLKADKLKKVVERSEKKVGEKVGVKVG